MGLIKEQTDIPDKDRRVCSTSALSTRFYSYLRVQCRKTMARIKQILNERRIAYESAYALEYARIKEAGAARAQEAENVEEQNAEASSEAGSQVPIRGRRRRRATSRVMAEVTTIA